MLAERRKAVTTQWLLSPHVKKMPDIDKIAGFKDPEDKYKKSGKTNTFESKEQKESEINSLKDSFGI